MLSKALLATVRRYSPISPDQRANMQRTLTWLPQQAKLGVKEAQRVADAFRLPIHTVGRATIAGYLEYGDWLIRLQEKVPHGFWLMLFKDAAAAGLARPLPISSKVAQAYMRIARNPILSNPDILDELPPHWRTLQTLTRVPDTLLNDALSRGRIHPGMQRAEAEALIPRATSAASWAMREPAPRISNDIQPVVDAARRVLATTGDTREEAIGALRYELESARGPAIETKAAMLPATEFFTVDDALDQLCALARRLGLSDDALADVLRRRATALEARSLDGSE